MTVLFEAKLPEGDAVNPWLLRNGQMWKTQKRACYKCTDFNSNMPMQGRCDRLPGQLIVSGDECLGDTCRNFKLRPDARRAETPEEA